MSNKEQLIDNLTEVINLINKDLSENGQKNIEKTKEKLTKLKKKSKNK